MIFWALGTIGHFLLTFFAAGLVHGACDYLITERAIMETDKGALLHAGLNRSGRVMEIGFIGDVVLRCTVRIARSKVER